MAVGEPGVQDFPPLQETRDDPDDFTTCGQRGVGHQAHQANLASAIHEAPAGRCETPAYLSRHSRMARIVTSPGAAENAQSFAH